MIAIENLYWTAERAATESCLSNWWCLWCMCMYYLCVWKDCCSDSHWQDLFYLMIVLRLRSFIDLCILGSASLLRLCCSRCQVLLFGWDSPLGSLCDGSHLLLRTVVGIMDFCFTMCLFDMEIFAISVHEFLYFAQNFYLFYFSTLNSLWLFNLP